MPSPFDCFLVLRGIRTLHLRMAKHQENALAVARLLEASPKVDRVSYPGLKSHPQHHLFEEQMKGGSGMIGVWLRHGEADGAGLAAATKFLQDLELFCLAESLGGVEGLAEIPAVMTHGSIPPGTAGCAGHHGQLCPAVGRRRGHRRPAGRRPAGAGQVAAGSRGSSRGLNGTGGRRGRRGG